MSIVTECKYIKHYHIKNKYTDDYFEGFMITTSNDIINDTIEKTPESLTMIFPREYTKITNFFVLISDSLDCCEKFGVDMLKKENFVGSTIKKITFSNTTKFYNSEDDTEDFYDSKCIIDVDTDRGLYKFVIYNNHNGYYPHDAYFSFNNYVHSERL